MTFRLFLDDERYPPDHDPDWVVVRNFDEAVQMVVARGLPDEISFDHDLGDGLTGHDFAIWLVGYCLDNRLRWTTTWFVHSMNPIGKENIESLLRRFEQFCEEETLT